MTKDEALTMCLEYIETDKHERKYVRHAIKAALEQPVQKPVACRFCHDKKGCWAWQCYHCGEIDDVQQPAAQPEQEPVARVDEADDGFFAEILPDRTVKVGQLLYAAPPPVQREWVGLTDEEQLELYVKYEYEMDGWGLFYDAIEAALRSKNK